MIMLREATSTTRNQKVDDCDCGIMTELKDGLEGVLNLGEDKKEEGDESEDGGQFLNGHKLAFYMILKLLIKVPTSLRPNS